jgi:hypothetical protein
VLSAAVVCDCGTGIETAEHIIWEFPRPTNERAELINILTKNGINQTLRSFAEMLKMQNLREVKGLIKFINDIPKFM